MVSSGCPRSRTGILERRRRLGMLVASPNDHIQMQHRLLWQFLAKRAAVVEEEEEEGEIELR